MYTLWWQYKHHPNPQCHLKWSSLSWYAQNGPIQEVSHFLVHHLFLILGSKNFGRSRSTLRSRFSLFMPRKNLGPWLTLDHLLLQKQCVCCILQVLSCGKSKCWMIAACFITFPDPNSFFSGQKNKQKSWLSLNCVHLCHSHRSLDFIIFHLHLNCLGTLWNTAEAEKKELSDQEVKSFRMLQSPKS